MVELPDLEYASASDVLAWAISVFGDSLAISTSFQKEGMVAIDLAVRLAPNIRVFTLDTGCLPAETHQFIETIQAHYGIQVERVSPEPVEVGRMLEEHGPDLFYQDVPRRMLCCHIRKVRPLDRKLKTLKAWVVGLRRSQSETRAAVKKIETVQSAVRISPLADWTAAQVDEYIRKNNVPVHPLYSQGYTSIGCGPCTRAVESGEAERAGRWWWEQGSQKECGIHFSPEGKAERTVDVLIRKIIEHA